MAEAKKTSTKKKTEEVTEETMPVEAVEAEVNETKKPTAKAGKRSEKSLKETEEKIAKEERKTSVKEAEAEEAAKPKQPVKPARPAHERKGKGYQAAYAQIDHTKEYKLSDSMELAVKTSPVKFDATVEMHINLGVDPRQADQNVRDMLVMPEGTGKTVRIAVLADADNVAAATKAGADIAGGDDLLQKFDKGVFDFDMLIATPAMMPKLGKYARVLGPKGLMPNPKSGTVTADVAKAVKEAKAGKVEYRVDSTGIVHCSIGKVSFGAARLLKNAEALLASIKHNKPASLKSTYIKSAHVTTSMGPSVKLDLNEIK